MADIVPDALRIRLKAIDSLGSGGMKPAYPETLVNRVLDYPYDVTIRISGAITGQIDAYKATSTTFGVVKIGSNIQVRGGTIFVQSAVLGEYGVTTPVFNIEPDAVYYEDQYPTVSAVQEHVAYAIQHTLATSSGAGIVQIGNNIKLGDGDEDHAAMIWVAEGSPNERGVVRLYNEVTEATNGAVTPSAVMEYVATAAPQPEDATYFSKGIVQISSGGALVIDGGTLSTANATNVLAGVMTLHNEVSDITSGAITPAAVSGALVSKVNLNGALTSGHLLKADGNNAVVDAGVFAGGTVFQYAELPAYTDPGITLATERGISSFLGTYDATSLMALADEAFGPGVIHSMTYGSVEGGVITPDIANTIGTDPGMVYVLEDFDDAQHTQPTVPTVNAVVAYVSSAAITVLPDADYNSKGIVQVGSNIYVTGGTISVSSAVITSPSVPGVVTLYNEVSTATNGAITPAAVSGALEGTSDVVVLFSGGGRLKDSLVYVGGSSFDNAAQAPDKLLATEAGVSAYVASAAPRPGDADYNSKGIVQIGSNIIVSSGTISVLDATSQSAGVVKLYNELTPAMDGAITPAFLSGAFTSFSGVYPITADIGAQGGTVSIADATTISKGAVILQSALDTTDESVDYENHSAAVTPGAALMAFVTWELAD